MPTNYNSRRINELWDFCRCGENCLRCPFPDCIYNGPLPKDETLHLVLMDICGEPESRQLSDYDD